MKTRKYINTFSATILTLAVAICGCGKPGAAQRNAAGTNDPASQKDVATAIPDNSQTPSDLADIGGLVSMLKNKDMNVRAAAAEELSKLGSKAAYATEALKTANADANWQVGSAAADALIKILGPAEALKNFESIFKDPAKNLGAKGGAARGLGQLGKEGFGVLAQEIGEINDEHLLAIMFNNSHVILNDPKVRSDLKTEDIHLIENKARQYMSSPNQVGSAAADALIKILGPAEALKNFESIFKDLQKIWVRRAGLRGG